MLVYWQYAKAVNGLPCADIFAHRESGMVGSACVGYWAFSRELPPELSVGCAVRSSLQIAMFFTSISCALKRIAGGTAEECPSSRFRDKGIFFMEKGEKTCRHNWN